LKRIEKGDLLKGKDKLPWLSIFKSNIQGCRIFKGYSPLQISCNLTGMNSTI